MSSAFSGVFGNERLVELLSREISRGELSHAFLLEGGQGSGRHTLARAAALALAEAKGAAAAERRRIETGSSPDVRSFGLLPGKKTFGVDTVRAVRAECALAPSELPFRVFILENAERMTIAAQNASLKILEEPPAEVYFFLLTESARLLLDTLRSRAALLRMERFSPARLREYLSSGHPSLPKNLRKITSEERISAAIEGADGRIGRLLAALGGGSRARKKAEGTEEEVTALLRAASSRDVRQVFAAVGALPGKSTSGREELCAAMAGAERAARDLLVLRVHSSEDLLFFPARGEAEALARRFTRRQLMRLRDIFHEGAARLAAGAGMALFKTALAEHILAALA